MASTKPVRRRRHGMQSAVCDSLKMRHDLLEIDYGFLTGGDERYSPGRGGVNRGSVAPGWLLPFTKETYGKEQPQQARATPSQLSQLSEFAYFDFSYPNFRVFGPLQVFFTVSRNLSFTSRISYYEHGGPGRRIIQRFS